MYRIEVHLSSSNPHWYRPTTKRYNALQTPVPNNMSDRFETILKACVLLAIIHGSIFSIMVNPRDRHTSIIMYDHLRKKTSSNHHLHHQFEQVSIVKSKFGALNQLIRIYSIIKFAIICFVFVKYLAMYLIDSNILSTYRFLDCYLIGRFVLNAGLGKSSKYVGGLLMFGFLLLRGFILLLEPDFKFHILEFLLNDYDEILSQEIKFIERHEYQTGVISPSTRSYLYQDVKDRRDKGQDEAGSETDLRHQQSLFFVKKVHPTGGDGCCCAHDDDDNNNDNNYDDNDNDNADDDDDNDLVMKLNRTSKSWVRFKWFTLYYFGACSGYVIVLIPYFYFIVGPSILTDYGFKMNYMQCNKWLDQIRNDSGVSNQDINQIDYTNLSSHYLNQYYDFARIGADLLENSFVYSEIICATLAFVYMCFILASDLHVNASEIKLKLMNLIDQLRQIRFTNSHYYNHFHYKSTNWIMCGHLSKSNCPEVADIIDLQSILADHFHLICQYNSFISFYATFCLLVWTFYTIVVCGWMSVVGRSFVDIELYIGQLVATITLMVILGIMASVRTRNRQLYGLISCAMALDDNWHITKDRWTTILKYYYPKPLSGHTIFGSSEISWLFIMKVSGTKCCFVSSKVSLLPMICRLHNY